MEKQWRKMTKGQQIEYAIFKAVSEYSFVEWLETWGDQRKKTGRNLWMPEKQHFINHIK